MSRRTRQREEGQVLAMFAAVVVVLIGISALVVDLGMQVLLRTPLSSHCRCRIPCRGPELHPTPRSAPVTPAMQQDARAEALGIVLTDLIGDNDRSSLPSGQRYRLPC